MIRQRALRCAVVVSIVGGGACKRSEVPTKAEVAPSAAPARSIAVSAAAPAGSASRMVDTCAGPYRSFWADPSNQPPAGGAAFRLSQAFPKTMPATGERPWRQANPFAAQTLEEKRTESDKYVRALLKYVLEGNIGRAGFADFDVCTNPVRRWFHVPWMDANAGKGREYVHGLTRELSPARQKLAETQSRIEAAWAVGIYNEPGGYAIGQIFTGNSADDVQLPSSHVTFPEGTVIGKALFTTADSASVPYLKGAPQWQANIVDPACTQSCTRSLRAVNLAQFDVAVVDERAPLRWVFGTFIYDGSADSALGWGGLKPVGLMWGNDPGLSPSGTKPDKHAPSERGLTPPDRVKASFMFTDDMPAWLKKDLGCAGRLDGPIDNPRSSCMSCHATASVPVLVEKGQANPCANNTPAPDRTIVRPRILGDFNKQCGDAAIDAVYFRDIGQAEPVDHSTICSGKNWISLDFSLQLSDALANYLAQQSSPTAAPNAKAKSNLRALGVDELRR